MSLARGWVWEHVLSPSHHPSPPAPPHRRDGGFPCSTRSQTTPPQKAGDIFDADFPIQREGSVRRPLQNSDRHKCSVWLSTHSRYHTPKYHTSSSRPEGQAAEPVTRAHGEAEAEPCCSFPEFLSPAALWLPSRNLPGTVLCCRKGRIHLLHLQLQQKLTC